MRYGKGEHGSGVPGTEGCKLCAQFRDASPRRGTEAVADIPAAPSNRSVSGSTGSAAQTPATGTAAPNEHGLVTGEGSRECRVSLTDCRRTAVQVMVFLISISFLLNRTMVFVRKSPPLDLGTQNGAVPALRPDVRFVLDTLNRTEFFQDNNKYRNPERHVGKGVR